MDELLNNPEIQKLLELTRGHDFKLHQEGNNALLEFDNGEVISLTGGTYELEDMAPVETLRCDFCGAESTDELPVISPPHRESPLICPRCAILAVQTFAKHGVRMEFDVKFKGE